MSGRHSPTEVPIEEIADSLEYSCDIRGVRTYSSHDTEDGIIAEIDARREEEHMAKKKPTLARVTILDATPERLEHANDDHYRGDDGNRYMTDSPLERMHKRGQLSSNSEENETLYAAGLRYYSDWYAAGMSPVQAMDPGAVGGGGGPRSPAYAKSERATTKLQEWQAARAAVPARLRGVLDAVVLEQKVLTEVAGSRGRPRNRAKVHLVDALGTLAHHYGISQRAAA